MDDEVPKSSQPRKIEIVEELQEEEEGEIEEFVTAGARKLQVELNIEARKRTEREKVERERKERMSRQLRNVREEKRKKFEKERKEKYAKFLAAIEKNPKIPTASINAFRNCDICGSVDCDGTCQQKQKKKKAAPKVNPRNPRSTKLADSVPKTINDLDDDSFDDSEDGFSPEDAKEFADGDDVNDTPHDLKEFSDETETSTSESSNELSDDDTDDFSTSDEGMTSSDDPETASSTMTETTDDGKLRILDDDGTSTDSSDASSSSSSTIERIFSHSTDTSGNDSDEETKYRYSEVIDIEEKPRLMPFGINFKHVWRWVQEYRVIVGILITVVICGFILVLSLSVTLLGLGLSQIKETIEVIECGTLTNSLYDFELQKMGCVCDLSLRNCGELKEIDLEACSFLANGDFGEPWAPHICEEELMEIDFRIPGYASPGDCLKVGPPNCVAIDGYIHVNATK